MSHCTGSSLPLLHSSKDYMDAELDQALIPPSILAHKGKHRGYGTWQLMTSEEGFRAALYRHTRVASPAVEMSASVAFACRKISACLMKWL